MKILHVIAQKPQDTGSGIYLKNLIWELSEYSHAMVAGIDAEDRIEVDIPFYPVVFRREGMDFPIAGMSDIMPYESTLYRELRGERLRRWKEAFRVQLERAREEFQPDIVISHHLYLLTSMVREVFSTRRVVGVCHATDLRQIISHDLERDYIKKQIPALDRIVALHPEQRRRIERIFPVEGERIEVVGLGYNSSLFYEQEDKREEPQVWYVGKISRSKGVEELLDAVALSPKGSYTLNLAGGAAGDEGDELIQKAKGLKGQVEILGRLSQEELAGRMKGGDLLVLPSYYEGFPMVVIEALAVGMRVVVNDLPGLREGLGSANLRSGRIHLMPMPELEGIDRISRHARKEYIRNLDSAIRKVLTMEDTGDSLSLEGFTWRGIGRKYRKLMGEL